MKRILILMSALFLFAVAGIAQNPSKSALEVLDGRNYKLLIDREIRNNWGKVSDSFAIGLVTGPAEFTKQPDVAINSEEVVVTNYWLIVNDGKITCRLGNILDYQLAGDKDVNKKDNMDVRKDGLLEYTVSDYKDVAKKNKRIVTITSYHESGLVCVFEFTFTKKGKVLVRLFDRKGDQIREYKGTLDANSQTN